MTRSGTSIRHAAQSAGSKARNTSSSDRSVRALQKALVALASCVEDLAK